VTERNLVTEIGDNKGLAHNHLCISLDTLPGPFEFTAYQIPFLTDFKVLYEIDISLAYNLKKPSITKIAWIKMHFQPLEYYPPPYGLSHPVQRICPIFA